MKTNTLFALILTALFATACSSVFSRVQGSHSRPEMAVMVDPQTGRPYVARTGGWINGELHSVSPYEYATVAASDSEADYTRSIAGANWTYSQAIAGFNQTVGYNPGGGLEEVNARLDEIGQNNILTDCVLAGGTAEACAKDPTSALQAKAAPVASTAPASQPQATASTETTPQVASAASVVQPQVVAPSAQAPAATASGGYYLQLKAAAMLAKEPIQLAEVFGKAASHANSPKARAMFEAQAAEIRKMSPAEMSAMQSEKQLVTYQPFLN